MPVFVEEIGIGARPIEIWKVLHDPRRITDWMSGIMGVEDVRPGRGGTRLTLHDRNYPGKPMPHVMSDGPGGGIVMSCLSYDTVFTWRLHRMPDGTTRVEVTTETPVTDAAAISTRRGEIVASLDNLKALCEQRA